MTKLPENVYVLIMAGGSGTRFWPKSRLKKPKQFLKLWDDKTLLEHSIERFSENVSEEKIWVITNRALGKQSAEILKLHKKVRILEEPSSKNTAACIYWGIQEIHKLNPEAQVVVMAADSYIGEQDVFLSAVEMALTHSKKTHSLVTLGIKPVRPETGYGYIEVKEKVSSKKIGDAVPVNQFVEKPDLRSALRYMESGKYLWNAGMFIFDVKNGIDAFKKSMPNLVTTFEKFNSIDEVYQNISTEDAVSVDYGVMETASEQGIAVSVVPVDCGWNDVGSFPALEEINCETQGDVVSHDSACNVVITDQGVVALLGVSDLVVVRDQDVVLVAAKHRAQDMKELLGKVREKFPEKL